MTGRTIFVGIACDAAYASVRIVLMFLYSVMSKAGLPRYAGTIVPSPVTRFIKGGRVCQTLDRVSKTLFDST